MRSNPFAFAFASDGTLRRSGSDCRSYLFRPDILFVRHDPFREKEHQTPSDSIGTLAPCKTSSYAQGDGFVSSHLHAFRTPSAVFLLSADFPIHLPLGAVHFLTTLSVLRRIRPDPLLPARRRRHGAQVPSRKNGRKRRRLLLLQIS